MRVATLIPAIWKEYERLNCVCVCVCKNDITVIVGTVKGTMQKLQLQK